MTERRGARFWLSAVAGWALIGWGIRGALHHHIDTRPAQLAKFVVGGALLHDLLFAPFVLLAGTVVSRTLRGRWRAPLQAVLIISGCAALFAWPEVRDYARVNHNPSSLPHNYTANLLVTIAGVVLAVTALTIARRRRARA